MLSLKWASGKGGRASPPQGIAGMAQPSQVPEPAASGAPSPGASRGVALRVLPSEWRLCAPGLLHTPGGSCFSRQGSGSTSGFQLSFVPRAQNPLLEGQGA